MTLEQELQESIKKNLPQQVGEVLKERLEQADRDAKRVLSLEKEVKNLEEQEEVFKGIIEDYKKFDARNTDLDSREKTLEDKIIKLEIEQLKYQLSAEKDKTVFSQNLAMGLVRNTEYRKTIFDSENVGGTPVIDGQGNYHYPIPTSKSYCETNIQE